MGVKVRVHFIPFMNTSNPFPICLVELAICQTICPGSQGVTLSELLKIMVL